TLRDWAGDVQVMLTADVLDGWRSTVDIGDHVGVTGEVVTTKHGEVSVRASAWTLTAKCLHPLPDKHRGLSGEALVRQRHLDLIVNPAAREMLRVRSAAVHAVRTRPTPTTPTCARWPATSSSPRPPPRSAHRWRATGSTCPRRGAR